MKPEYWVMPPAAPPAPCTIMRVRTTSGGMTANSATTPAAPPYSTLSQKENSGIPQHAAAAAAAAASARPAQPQRAPEGQPLAGGLRKPPWVSPGTPGRQLPSCRQAWPPAEQ